MASKLLGPTYGALGARRRLQFSLSRKNIIPKPATDNATTGLARPSANQKRGLEIIGGQTGAKRHRLGDGDLNTIDSDTKA